MPKSVCSQCKGDDRCDIGRKDTCWCFKYPSLQLLHELIDEPFEVSESCLCEDCLKNKINKIIDRHATLFKNGEIVNHGPKFSSNKALTDGIDYYKENGNWVFKSWSHMKRGHCCGNDCRHCPYPKDQKK